MYNQPVIIRKATTKKTRISRRDDRRSWTKELWVALDWGRGTFGNSYKQFSYLICYSRDETSVEFELPVILRRLMRRHEMFKRGQTRT